MNEIDQLRAEIARLQQENAMLRSQLGNPAANEQRRNTEFVAANQAGGMVPPLKPDFATWKAQEDESRSLARNSDYQRYLKETSPKYDEMLKAIAKASVRPAPRKPGQAAPSNGLAST